MAAASVGERRPRCQCGVAAGRRQKHNRRMIDAVRAPLRAPLLGILVLAGCAGALPREFAASREQITVDRIG